MSGLAPNRPSRSSEVPGSAALEGGEIQGQQWRSLLKRLIELQEDERREVARELHEGAGQMLTSLLFRIKVLEGATSLDEIRDLVPDLKEQASEALETMRQMSVALRPPLLDDLGLATTLRDFVRDFGIRHRMDVSFSVGGTESRLERMTEITVFRIVQEALSNVGKHAQASKLVIGLQFEEERLLVLIDDNGNGMDLDRVMTQAMEHQPVGIMGMQARADFLGGTCEFLTSPGNGVQITLEVPLRTTTKEL